MTRLKEEHPNTIAVDFTAPGAVNRNAEMYARCGVPFVMGTTGGDREKLAQAVKNSGICAVIAPNMALPVVVFQAMMEYAAETFPGAFAGLELAIVESHQVAKKDTSGTAKAVVACFKALGIPFEPEQIIQIRNLYHQRVLGVPEWALGGHGWHKYMLRSLAVQLMFEHNISGREPYVDGVIKSIGFLADKVAAGAKGQVYSMIDVAKAQ